ncbi:MAG: ABC transporter permease [Geminicoccaceae bacterium]
MILPWYARLGLRTVAALALVVLYGPLLLTMFLSFFDLRRGTVVWDSFGLHWYAALWRNRGIIEALGNTLLVGFAAVCLAILLGLATAFWYHAHPGRPRAALQAVIFLPFVLPPIVTGLSLLIFFRETGVPRSLITVTIGHTVFVLALVYQILLARLQSLSPSLIEASSDLGASAFQTFRHVLLPHLASAIATAAVLAFALSFDETLITLLVTGTDSTLPLRLWAMMRTGFTPDINALVTLILLGSVGVCMATVRLIRI